MSRTQGQDRYGSDLSITSCEVPETVKPGEEFTAVAVVSFRRREPPLHGQTVIFEVNGQEIGEAPTDGEGRASVDHRFDAVGVYAVTAQIRGIPPSRVRRRVSCKSDVPKAPTDFDIEPRGDDGNYELDVLVFHQVDEKSPRVGVPGAEVIVSDGKTTIGTKPSGPNGTTTITVNFREREKNIAVRVIGIARVERLKLLGPEQPSILNPSIT